MNPNSKNGFEDITASIAQVLNAAGIPCVLWGHALLQVHGVPTILGSIDFVVPDNELVTAASAIDSMTAAPDALVAHCPDANCSKISPDRPTPPPSFHVHLKADWGVSVGLYLQWNTLWFLPPLDSVRRQLLLLVPGKDGPLPAPYLLATDQKALPPWRPGRGNGFITSAAAATTTPVVVVQAHVLLEAYMRIYVRDVDETMGGFALSMIGYMEEYVDADGLLDVDQLPDNVRALYMMHRDASVKVRPWTHLMQTVLGPEPVSPACT